MRLLNSLQDGSIDVEFPALDMAEPLSKYGFELLGYDLQSCVIIFEISSKNRSQNVSLTSPKLHYRVGHLVVQLGWVDLDLGCSTILLGP